MEHINREAVMAAEKKFEGMSLAEMMISLRDVDNIEGAAENKEEYFVSIQRAINSGSAWSFNGHYGRSMMRAIEAGECMLGPNPARDAYGNRIPSRTEVQDGTKGSRGFVVAQQGEDWAKMLEEGEAK